MQPSSIEIGWAVVVISLCFMVLGGGVVVIVLAGQKRLIAAQQEKLAEVEKRELEKAALIGELEEYKRQLESRVEDRTAQLRSQALQLEKALNDQKLAQTRLIQSEKMAALGKVVAGLAHEINNPLGLMLGNVDHLSDYLRNYATALQAFGNLARTSGINRELIDKIVKDQEIENIEADTGGLVGSCRDAGERISRLLKSLQLFAHHNEAEFKSIDIHERIDSIVALFLERQTDAVVSKSYGRVPPIECYGAEITQLFLSLLLNAWEAVVKRNRMEQRAQGHLWITTALDVGRSVVRATVADDGCGIAPEIQDKIFDPFFTTKPVGQGVGLGLSVAYAVVVKHRGTISFKARPQGGTELTVELPVI